jgi:hypothetical protein
MTALSKDRNTQRKDGEQIPAPVKGSTVVYGGSLTAVNAAGYLVPGADTAGLIFHGIADDRGDNSAGADGAVVIRVTRRGLFRFASASALTRANVGDNVFLKDDQTVALTADVAQKIFCGIIAEVEGANDCWVDIEPAIEQADVATHIADTSAAHSASAISIADAGEFTAETEVEGALAEVYQDLLSAQATIPIALGAITQEDGTALLKQATTVAGFAQLADKETVIHIPVNCSAGESLGFSVPVPQDLDDTADISVHVLVGKNADNDALTIDCEVYPCAPGDVANADIQDTAAQAITQAAVERVFTCGADGVLAAPGTLSVVLALGGVNDGDAVYLYGAWVEYKRKILTA